MTLPSVLALLVAFVALPLNWYVTYKLWRLSLSKPHIWPLRERAVTALALALVVTVFALVFLNNELEIPILNSEQTKLLTRGMALVLSVPPALFWLWKYRNA